MILCIRGQVVFRGGHCSCVAKVKGKASVIADHPVLFLENSRE